MNRCVTFLFTLFLMGLSVLSADDTGLKLLSFDTGRYQIEILDPEAAPDKKSTGDRFLRGSWLRRLVCKDTGQEILRVSSLHPRLPLFGCPFEIYPGPRLKAGPRPGWDTRMQIGVGIVREKGEGRYETIPVEWFSWSKTLQRTPQETILTARQTPAQYAGYQYELTITTILKQNSDTIRILFDFANIGKKKIETELYAHPFFHAPAGFGEGWYILKNQTPTLLKSKTAHSQAGAERIRVGAWPQSRQTIELRGNPTPVRVDFWRNPNDCFSLEPFWNISVEPGEKQTIEFFLQGSKSSLQ